MNQKFYFISIIILILISAQYTPGQSFDTLGIPTGTYLSYSVSKASGDGSVIVGFISYANDSSQAYRWTETAGFVGLGDLPGGKFISNALAVSGDGNIIVGEATNSYSNGYTREPFRWTQGGGMQGLGYLSDTTEAGARDISTDGSAIVGNDSTGWIWKTGMFSRLTGNPLEFPLGGPTPPVPNGISADGSVVVGQGVDGAFRWTEQGGLVTLGPNTIATNVSADGNTVVGFFLQPSQAFRWTQNTGLVNIGTLPGQTISRPSAVSGDGSIIVGYSHNPASTNAFIWKEEWGQMIDLKSFLQDSLGLTLPPGRLARATDINDDGYVIIGLGDGQGWRATLGVPEINIIDPTSGIKWIAGEQDTIRWDKTGVDSVNIFISQDFQNNTGTFDTVVVDYPADSLFYIWNIPDTILSTKCVIQIVDNNDSTIADTSDLFKIKGYRLTRLDGNGDYIAYDIFTDRWGFGNSRSDVWPTSWWSQFNYQGTDPFTGMQYSQWQVDSIFAFTLPGEFPDWEAWVNAYTTNVCYISTILGVYSPTALTHWDAKNNFWVGSCFGISASNALAFSHTDEFVSRFPSFPSFTDPITVNSDSNVIPVISELFSHQFGNPTLQAQLGRWNTITPNETLNEVKQMLLQDDVPIRTLSIWNNNGAGGHSILPYELVQDDTQKEFYYLYVYDNSHPSNTTALVLIDTTGNSNNGTWLTQYAWTNWGGSKKLMLELESSTYLNDPILPKNNGDFISPFILSGDDLQVYNNIDVNTRIYDSQGNLTGFVNGTVYNEIANSVPQIYLNGSETPPYGYYLPTDNYSIQVSDFISDTVGTFFFTGNKSYLYKRTETITSETDRLFFDGGVSVVNPDQVDKSISLVNIINESTQEKLFALRQIALAQNDSVKIENPDDNNLKFISYGTEKNYQIELNYATQLGLGRFANNSISITQNTTHLLVPNWGDFADLQLTIYVDEGNDGTIDDTLYIINNVTGVGDDQGSLIPTEYRLEQNYPNPFNNSTVIKYSIPQEGLVTLKVYNLLGEEVARLVNDIKQTGNYEVSFDATRLPSGVYFYRIQAGSFIDTKKMILLK